MLVENAKLVERLGACQLFHVPQTASTNTALSDVFTQGIELADGASLGLLADQQTAGQGRRGNSWASAPGNLFLSLLLRPMRPLAQWASLSLVAGYSLHQTLAVDFGCMTQIKWPNDLLADGAKLSGLLPQVVHRQHHDQQQSALVLGLGVNLHSPPGDLGRKTTSVLQLTGAHVHPLDLARAFITRFHGDLAQWEANGFAAFHEHWKTNALGWGEQLQVRLPNEVFAAKMLDLDPNGALWVLPQGESAQRCITAGEVFFADEGAV